MANKILPHPKEILGFFHSVVEAFALLRCCKDEVQVQGMKLELCTPSLSVHIFITPILTLSGQISSNFIKTLHVFIKIFVLDCILYYINNL